MADSLFSSSVGSSPNFENFKWPECRPGAHRSHRTSLGQLQLAGLHRSQNLEDDRYPVRRSLLVSTQHRRTTKILPGPNHRRCQCPLITQSTSAPTFPAFPPFTTNSLTQSLTESLIEKRLTHSSLIILSFGTPLHVHWCSFVVQMFSL